MILGFGLSNVVPAIITTAWGAVLCVGFTLLLTGGTGAWAQQAGGTPSINGIINAAGCPPCNPVAPGSIASVFGTFQVSTAVSASGVPLPTSLGGLSLRFGDSSSNASLFFASATQVNVQIPWTTVGACPNWPTVTVGCSLTWLTATVNGQAGQASQTFPLVPFAPGIFSMNGEGSGQGAILNSRYQLVDSSNPAQVGDVIQIYCTGLGAVTNEPATGSPALSSPLSYTTTTPTVTIAGIPAKVLFSGLAPGDVGLYQVNAQIPSGITPGLAVMVSMSIGGANSNAVTIAAGSYPRYTISTVAGGLGSGYSGDGGPATSAQLNQPYGAVAVDSVGNLYIGDQLNYRVREVSNGVITTVAGNGGWGFSGDSGPATSAQLDPTGVAVDSAGNLYIADTGNDRVRKVSNGVITTVAGNGTPGFSGDNGPATSAQLFSPVGVAVDSVGNLYIADSVNNRIRKVSNGVITTVAGNGTQGFNGDGPATSAELYDPAGVAVDFAGNLYIADERNNRIREVSNGVITTVAGNGTPGFSGDNGPATRAELYDPAGVAVDFAGNLYIADGRNNRIREVSNGLITTVAGNGTAGYSGDNGPATSAQLNFPSGVAVDSAGNVFITDEYNSSVRVLCPVAP